MILPRRTRTVIIDTAVSPMISDELFFEFATQPLLAHVWEHLRDAEQMVIMGLEDDLDGPDNELNFTDDE